LAQVTDVTATPPLFSSGGATPNISLPGVFIGPSNTAIGAFALTNNTTGAQNTAAGGGALRNNTTGDANTATGRQALRNNTTGSDNTATGHQALRNNTTGDANTAVGFAALFSNSSGIGNTASGVGALAANTTGNNNTANGLDALASNATGESNTASGLQALQNNSAGSSNTATGLAALRSNTIGLNNTAVGVGALLDNIDGSNNTAVGFEANVLLNNLTNATAIGNGAVVTASNKIRLGNSAVTVIEGQVAFTASSDANQKENFRPVDGEEVLRKLRGFGLTSWNYIGHDPAQFRHYGPMAQDFFAAFGHDTIGTIGTPTTINSGDIAGILMIAAQALEQRTAELGKETDSLRAENAELKSRLDAMEQLVRQQLNLTASAEVFK
jgi:hypothetical protein